MCSSDLAAALMAAFLAQAQPIYRWLDAQGKVHYSSEPPPAGARDIQRSASATDPAIATTLGRINAAAKSNAVVLYQAPMCESACRDARTLLEARAIPFRLVDLDDMAAFEKFRAETGASEVPVLRLGRSTLKGFEPSGWNAALDAAGYPARVPEAVRAALKPRPVAPARGRYESAQPAGPVAIRLFTSPDCAEIGRAHV